MRLNYLLFAGSLCFLLLSVACGMPDKQETVQLESKAGYRLALEKANGAVAFFGTNDLKEIERRAETGDKDCEIWLRAYSLNIAKYIAALAATVDGKIDVILLTGGTANSKRIADDIIRRIAFIAPVEIYAGENELESLAENGYAILSGSAKIHRYDKSAIIPD